MYEIISENPLFRGISSSDIEVLFKNGIYQVKKFKPKDIVAIQGGPCNYLMIIVSGTVQGQMVDSSGRLIVIEEISAPFAIAVAFIYAEKNELPVSIVALRDSTILFVRRDYFTDILQQNKMVLLNYLTVISNRSKFLSDKIHFLTFRTIKSKIADFLLKQLKQSGTRVIFLEETQQELADIFGVARPSLARTFKEMEDEGLINVERKKITLLDEPKLKRLAL